MKTKKYAPQTDLQKAEWGFILGSPKASPFYIDACDFIDKLVTQHVFHIFSVYIFLHI